MQASFGFGFVVENKKFNPKEPLFQVANASLKLNCRILGEGHLIFGNSEDYWIYLKTENKSFDFKELKFKRKIKYVISSYPPRGEKYGIVESTIEGVNICLLDKEGFEIFRIYAGTLCDDKPARGSFEISEKDYKKISGFFYAN